MPDPLAGVGTLPDRDERRAVLRALEDWLETPMLVLRVGLVLRGAGVLYVLGWS